jgi:hypothetical protein
MRYRFFLWGCPLILLITTSFVMPYKAIRTGGSKKWLVSENSNLCVNGTTNINKFSCEIAAYDHVDTLTVSKGDKDIVLSGCISLNVQSFDCHNAMMTRDLRKTLKDKQFPQLHISFLSLNKLPQLSAQPAFITGMVNIEIAGVKKLFEVNYQITQDAQKNIHLDGARDVNFSDFNLTPPSKLGGMIKTRDKLSVEFHLNMKAMD